MTAEQMKDAMRDYAESQFAGKWEAVSVMVLLTGEQAETLVALREADQSFTLDHLTPAPHRPSH